MTHCFLSKLGYIVDSSFTDALTPYYQRTAFIRDPDFMELAECLITGLESCVSFNFPLNSSLLNQWTDVPLQLSGLYTPSLQSFPIASGIDVANNTGILYTSVSPARIATDDKPMHEIIAEDRNIPIPRPLQTNELFTASIHNSPFRESAMPPRKPTYIKPYVSVEEIEEPTNVDVGVDCFETIDDDIEHDVQLTALLSRVDAMAAAVATERNDCESEPEPSTSAAAFGRNEAQNTESIRNMESAHLTVNIDDEKIVIEMEENNAAAGGGGGDQVNNVSPIMGNSLTSRMGWSSMDENDIEATETKPEPPSVQSTSRPLSRSNSINSSLRSPVDRFSYDSLLRRGVKRAQNGDVFYSRQIDFNDVWQRFESTLGIGHSNAMNNEAHSTNDSTALPKTTIDKSTKPSHDNESDEDGLVDFEFVHSDSLAMHFSMPELREMVQQTFKIPRETGLDSQNFACLSCGNPLGVGGSGCTTTQYVESIRLHSFHFKFIRCDFNISFL